MLFADYDDLTAEFELRKVDLPYEQVKHIFETNVAEVKKRLEPETFSSRELEETLEKLLALALASSNKSNEDEEPRIISDPCLESRYRR